MRAHKYNARRTTVDGITFDSAAEARRYSDLRLLERAGEISGLKRQAVYLLIEKQRRSDGTTERACKYVADFEYLRDGRLVVEDLKAEATKTPEYIIKRKLMLWVHGIEVTEVGARKR